ncbi:hypothetical protein LINGRAHAP2_LOCUS21624 [Linum grandiflorum]
MRWKDFLRSKEFVDSSPASYFHNVFNWDDSAGRNCFRSAKARFFAEHCNYSGGAGGRGNRRLPPLPVPSPDSLLDDVVWRDSTTEEERRLVAEIEEAQEKALRLAEEKAAAEEEEERLRRSIPLEEIKPTGWDWNDEGCGSSWQNPTLTGMIVGGDDCCGEWFKGGRSYKDNGAENRNRRKLAAAAENGVKADRRRVYWRRIPNNVGF